MDKSSNLYLNPQSDPDQPEQAPSQKISADLPCMHCAYNLYGLELAGRCPECGRYIRDTVERDDRALSNSDPKWVKQLSSGTAWLIAGFFVDLFFALLSIAAWLLITPIQTIEDIPGIVIAIVIISSINSLVIHVVGITMLTTPEYDAVPGTKSADLARYLTPAAYGFALISICMIFAATYESVWLGAILHTGSIVLINIATPATLHYFRHLAKRDGAQSLTAPTTAVLWGMSYTLMVVSACHLALLWRVLASAPTIYTADPADHFFVWVRNAGLAFLAVFSIWWVALLFRYHKHFTDAQSVGLYIAAQNKQKRQ